MGRTTEARRVEDLSGWQVAAICGAVAAANAGTIALARAISRTTTDGVPLWAAAGVTVAVLLLVPRRVWPWVLLATFVTNVVSNVTIDIPLDTATISAAANTIEPLLGALLVVQVLRGTPRLDDRRHLFVFLAGAVVVAPFVGAVIGAAGVQLVPDPPPFLEVLWRWYAGDSLGVLVVGTLILAWAQPMVVPRGVVHMRVEALAAGVAVVGLTFLAFWGSLPVLAYIVLPPLAWASIRFGVRGATLGGLAVAVIADWATIRDHGLFVELSGHGTHEALWQLQIYLAVLLVTALLLAVQVTELAERSAAEAALRADLYAAEAATTAKTQFLATMSHEIRTPMSAVSSLIELLCRTDLDAEQQGFVQTMRSSSEALLRIIDDTLDFSKIEAGMLEFESLPLAVDDEVRAMASLLEPAAVGKGITLRCWTQPPDPPVVLGDPVRIRQVLLNLVGNAIKFTSEGGVELSAEIPAADGTGVVAVRFVVHDTGIGMDPDRQEALFRPYTQAEHSTTRLYGGTGLGLSIVSRLIDMMRGTVTVASELGTGSTFLVTLPLPTAPAGAVPATRAPLLPKTGAVDARRIAGHVVLIADDNAINRDVLRRQLAVVGCACDAATDGQEALDRLTRGGISLLLTDCHMPVMDGFDLTKEIRAREAGAGGGARLPVVAVTANVMGGEGDRCLFAGMDAYLTKPVDVGRLAAVLADLLPPDLVRAEPTVDLTVLRDVVGEDEEALRDLLATFATSVQAQMVELQAGLEVDDRAKVKAAAHRVAGAAVSVGAGRLASLARAVELGAATAPPSTLGAAAGALRDELALVLDVVPEVEVRHA